MIRLKENNQKTTRVTTTTATMIISKLPQKNKCSLFDLGSSIYKNKGVILAEGWQSINFVKTILWQYVVGNQPVILTFFRLKNF